MADLTSLQRWVPFVPDIGSNRSLPAGKQLVLEVAASLPKEALIRFAEQTTTPTLAEGETMDAARIRILSEHVRLVGGPHTLGGVEVKTLADYAAICIGLSGHYNLRELFSAVGYFNSLSSTDALFSERLSGGTAFTLHRSAARDDDETDGP